MPHVTARRTRKTAQEKKPDRTGPVYCKACGVFRDRNEPSPWEWDAHLGEPDKKTGKREMFDTCSRECRESMGLPERKVIPKVTLDMLW